MSYAQKNTEEYKEGERNQSATSITPSPQNEQIIDALVQALNELFNPAKIVQNHYLVSKASGVSFQIPIHYIYEEYSIKSITTNKFLINRAIEKAENVTTIKAGEIIDSVKPTTEQLRKAIVIKGIKKEDELAMQQLVNKCEGVQEGTLSWRYNSHLNVINIICTDEKTASDLYNYLLHTTFRDAPIDCTLNFENLYISALENIKSRPKGPGGFQGGFKQQKNFYPPYFVPGPQYSMYSSYDPYTGMNGGGYKNYYSQPNYYMQRQGGYDNRGINPMNVSGGQGGAGPNNRSQQNYYNKNQQGGGDHLGRKGFNKKPQGKRGGRYQKNGYNRASNPSSNVEVNDSTFPPLSGDHQDVEGTQEQ